MSFTSNFLEELEKKKKERLEKAEKESGMLYRNKTATADDIAPVVSSDKETEAEKDTWVKTGAFEDGYQFGDVTKSALSTVGDVGVGLLEGATNAFEGISDLLLHGLGYGADAVGLGDAADFLHESATMDTMATLLDPVDNFAKKNSLLGNKVEKVEDIVGSFGGQMALAAGTGGLSLLAFGASAAGSGMSEAYMNGATDAEAAIYGLTTGAIEAGTEALFGGFGKFVKGLGLSRGIGGLDDMLASKLTSKITNIVLKNIAQFGIKASGEGLEEVLAGLGSAVAKKMTYMSDEDLGKLVEDENLLDSFLIGTVLSAGSQSGIVPGTKKGSLIEANRKGTDFVTGMTTAEESVVNKEVEKRIAEKEANGEKVTGKDKTKIYDSVVKDLEKGYISTDTIEEVLGGEDYRNYKNELKRQQEIDDELNALRNMKSGEMTDVQIERMSELKAMKPNTEMVDTLKFSIDENIRNGIKDSRLTESYNEQARRGQKFTADLSKYDKKQQATVQRAIDSGVLNNTNRSHDLVDMIAKLEADKEVKFDFANNAKLKESGFALEGKVINGLVTKDGITLNIDSHKALDTVAGHEITHVLEGTELYGELQKAIFDYAKAKGDYQGRYDTLTELYKDVKDADIDAELTADLVGDYLFTDADFINKLSTEHRNVFQKIYDEIKYLYDIATAGSKEARELEKVKRAFEKAYKEGGKASGDTKYSLGYHAGDLGKSESLGQQGYYRDTGHFGTGTYFVGDLAKIENYNKRDGKPAPKHAVEFDNYNLYKIKGDKDGFALHKQLKVIDGGINERWIAAASRDDFGLASITEWADIAKQKYGEDGAYSDEGQIYGLTELAKREDIEIPSKEQFAEQEGYDLSDEYLDGDYAEHLKDIVKSEIESINEKYARFRDAYFDLQLRFGFGDKVLNAMKRVLEYQNANNRSDMGAYKKDSLATVFMKSLGYEGIDTRGTALDNTAYGSVIYDLKGEDLARKNEIGTAKFSISDSDGKTLTKEQNDYFKDSKMRDENGNLKVMYHGSQDAGFHIFDPSMSDDGTSLFFVDRNEVAASYSGTSETYEAQTMRTAEDVNNFIKSIGVEGYEVVEADGKFTLLYEGEWHADSTTAKGIYEEFCWYEGIGNGDANYKVYLNLTNPLIVDAQGRNWNFVTREYSQEIADRYNSLTAEEKAALSDLAGWGDYGVFRSEIIAAVERGRSGNADAVDKVIRSAWEKLHHPVADIFSIAEDNFSEESIKQFAVKEMNTRDYAAKAKAEGYDGVIFKNIHDNGGYSNGSEGASTVAVAFSSEQIKSVANAKPTSDPDIRYSLSDSEGRQLSPAVQQRFGNSKVVDPNGNLKVVYHGTATGEFSIFDKAKGSVEGDFGSGFYFTDNEADVSEHYEGGGPDFDNKVGRRADEIWAEEPGIEYEEAERRAREELYKGSHKFEVYLNMENPATVGETILFDQESYLEQYNEEDYDDYDDYMGDVEQLIADDIDGILWDIERNVDIDSTDGIANVLYDAVAEGGIGLEQLKKRLNDLYLEDSNGNLVANEVARQIIESLGYDGIIDPSVSGKWNMDIEPGTTHYIVFKPNQIKAVTNENPTDNPDIHRSLSAEGDTTRRYGNIFGEDVKFNAPVREGVAKNATATPEPSAVSLAELATQARREEMRGAYIEDGTQYISDGSFIAELDTIDESIEQSENFPIERVRKELAEAFERRSAESYELDMTGIADGYIKVGDSLFDSKYVNAVIRAIENPAFALSNVRGGDKALLVTGDNGRAMLMPVRAGDNVNIVYEAQKVDNSAKLYNMREGEGGWGEAYSTAQEALNDAVQSVSPELWNAIDKEFDNSIEKNQPHTPLTNALIAVQEDVRQETITPMQGAQLLAEIYDNGGAEAVKRIYYPATGNLLPKYLEQAKQYESVAPEVIEDIMPEGFAPITEEEAATLARESFDSLNDADAPAEVETDYYEAPDNTRVDDNAVKSITESLTEVLALDESDSKAIADVVQRYSTGEISEAELFDEIKSNFGVKTIEHVDEQMVAVKRALRHYRLFVSDTIKGDIPEYNNLRKNLWGKLFTKKRENGGLPVDTAYMELSELYPGYFPEDIINPTEQFLIMAQYAQDKAKSYESFKIDDEDIQAAVDVITSEVAKSKEAAVMQNAEEDRLALMDEIAPVAEKTPEKAYEAIRPKKETASEPRMKSAEPRMKRADSKKTAPDGMEERSWYETSTGSEAVDNMITPDDIPDEVRYYQVKSNEKTLATANARLERDGYAKSREYFEGRMAERKLSVEDIALGERLIQEAAKAGDSKAVRDLIIDVSIIGTELGQRVQALSMIRRLTPEGQLKALTRTVERGKAKGDKAFEGVEITQEMIDHILKTYGKDGTYDQKKLNEAVEDVKQQIADQMKVGAMDYINAWRYLSMLGNPKTHIRNVVSNVAMLGTRAVKNAIARTIETIAPIENRTKTWRRASDAVKSFAEQTTKEMESAIRGENKYSDEGGIKAKRNIFKTKAGNWMANANTNAMEFEDAIFSKSAFRSTLSEYLTANGIKTEADIKNNPALVEKAKDYALEEAHRATFRQDSWLANKISEIERKNLFTSIAVGSIMPFKKTPINIAKTGLGYSPLGFARNIYDAVQVRKGNMDASEAIDHLAQTLTGTSLALIGYALAEAGLLNGAGDDDKEGKYDYQLGEQSYSFNFGGDTYSLSWLSPVAMPLFVGANAYEQLVEGKEWNPDVVTEALAQTLDPLSEMSFLSSLDDVLSSYDSGVEKFVGAGKSMVQNYITQFVPTFSSQIAQTADDTKRSTKAAADSTAKFFDETVNKVKYKIPGLRNTLEPTTDIWGNEVKQSDNVLERGFEAFLSPANKKEGIATAVDEELKALYGQVGESELLPAIPDNYINYEGDKYEMSARDYTEFKEAYGQTAFELMEKLFDTETYKNADSKTRADMVKRVYDYARDNAKLNYFTKFGVEYTNTTSDNVKVYKENPIKGAIEADLPVDEYVFSKEYPERYAFFKDNGISYATYRAANEDGKRAYTWAAENPEKYTLSKAVADDVVEYRRYAGEMYDIKADKDSSGKSITGSRKEKVLDYINGLDDLDYGAKIILFKSEYKADNTYNYDIIDYLNGRDDISYEDMVTILKELDFTVDKYGNISWD